MLVPTRATIVTVRSLSASSPFLLFFFLWDFILTHLIWVTFGLVWALVRHVPTFFVHSESLNILILKSKQSLFFEYPFVQPYFYLLVVFVCLAHVSSHFIFLHYRTNEIHFISVFRRIITKRRDDYDQICTQNKESRDTRNQLTISLCSNITLYHKYEKNISYWILSPFIIMYYSIFKFN